MTDPTEVVWRQRRLQELIQNKGLSAKEAEVVTEREAKWRPWEPITKRFPTLPNLERYRK